PIVRSLSFRQMRSPMSDYQTLAIRKEGPVDWVTFNRPDSLNALNRRMVDELLDYFGALYWDKSVRVVVLRGAGRAYCAGLDLKARDNSQGPNTPANGLTSQRRISEIRIAGASARMNAAFIRIGLSACDIGVSYFLPRLVGVSVASELMLTGRFINAERALRVGLVSEVGPDA